MLISSCDSSDFLSIAESAGVEAQSLETSDSGILKVKVGEHEVLCTEDELRTVWENVIPHHMESSELVHGEEIGHFAVSPDRLSLLYTTLKNMAPSWGFNQLFLLMEKQHNRGQDGAGIGSMKLNVDAGQAFMFRERSTSSKALAKIFEQQNKTLNKLFKKGLAFHEFPETIKDASIMGGTSSWSSEIWNIRFFWIHDMPSLF